MADRIYRARHKRGKAMNQDRSVALLVCRIGFAILFIWGGWLKLLNPGGFADQMAHEGMPMSGIFPWLAIIIEIGGGLALLTGTYTRTVALLFVPYVVAATLIDHRFWEMTGPAWGANRANFCKNLVIIAGFVLLWIVGPGALSVDAMFRRRTV
jgi:putative oxidoreductase